MGITRFGDNSKGIVVFCIIKLPFAKKGLQKTGVVKGDVFMEPLISVIVPVYKVEPYIRQSIDSIVNQTYRNLEIILVDDGSPDICGSICDEYAAKDTRIKVFHKENGGLSDARNYGIARANGDYLSFVDSDDWIEPDMYEALVNVAEGNNVDIVTCGIYNEHPNRTVADSVVVKVFVHDAVHLLKDMINGNIAFYAWNKLYHKICFSDLCFPRGHVFEDIATMHKVFMKASTVVCISKPLYHYRVSRKDSINDTYSMDNLTDYWLAHKSRYDFFAQDARFNTDAQIMDKLKQYCAVAIARTWRWCFASSAQEREEYASFFKEMQEFAAVHFPCFGMKGWPLFLRFSIFMAKFNNTFVFALLYYVNQGYRRVRG